MTDDSNPHEDAWTFALDSDGDLRFDHMNRIPVAVGPASVSQSLRVAMATVKGEDDLDPDFGLDVFRATRSVAFLRREIRRCLLYDDKDHDRVDAVLNVEVYRRPSRRAEVHATVLLEAEQRTLTFTIGGFF